MGCLLTIPDWEKSKFILIDMGTNGEVVVGYEGVCGQHQWQRTCPEGGQIRCGMRAVNGAIDRVVFDEEEGLRFRVIGNSYPRGICGSGIIDLTAALLKAGWIDRYGTISDKGVIKLQFSQAQMEKNLFCMITI